MLKDEISHYVRNDKEETLVLRSRSARSGYFTSLHHHVLFLQFVRREILAATKDCEKVDKVFGL